MHRLQQKCFIASAGLHLLLVSILFIGPAFLAPKSNKPDDLPLLDFIPLKTVDALVSGGGNPNGRLPAPPPPVPDPPKPFAPPKPQLPPEPEVKPQPELKEDPEPSLEPSPRRVRKPEISLKPVVRKPTVDTRAKERAEQQAQEREMAQLRRQIADRIGSAASHIEGGISSGTSIELKGPGGGGTPYANFYQAVKSVYARAWVVPDGVTDDSAAVDASVTIARDGTVTSWRILRASGNVGVDQSVRRTLDRVKYAAPLPDDAKENERTVPITFSVRAKRALG